MTMTMQTAERIAMALRRASIDGRWKADAVGHGLLMDLERFLSIRIQAGQPALEAMNWRLIEMLAVALLDLASAAMRDGLISGPTPCDIALFGRPPRPRIVSESDAPLLRVLVAA